MLEPESKPTDIAFDALLSVLAERERQGDNSAELQETILAVEELLLTNDGFAANLRYALLGKRANAPTPDLAALSSAIRQAACLSEAHELIRKKHSSAPSEAAVRRAVRAMRDAVEMVDEFTNARMAA